MSAIDNLENYIVHADIAKTLMPNTLADKYEDWLTCRLKTINTMIHKTARQGDNEIFYGMSAEKDMGKDFKAVVQIVIDILRKNGYVVYGTISLYEDHRPVETVLTVRWEA